MNGKIAKKLNGFGFISYGGQKDAFFHASKLVGVTFDELQEGANVTFDLKDDPKDRGKNAENVKLA